MIPITDAALTEVLYQATREEYGMYLPIIDPKDLRVIEKKLQDIRRDLGDERLRTIAIKILAEVSAIILYKKEVDLHE